MKFRRRKTYQDFKRYLNNHMQKKEKHDFEEQMMQDAFEEEAYDGLSRLTDDELDQDIHELRDSVHRRTQKRKRLVPSWFKYAASVLILAGIGLSVFIIDPFDKLTEDTRQVPVSVREKKKRKEKEKKELAPEKAKKEDNMEPQKSEPQQASPPPPQKDEERILEITDDEIAVEDEIAIREEPVEEKSAAQPDSKEIQSLTAEKQKEMAIRKDQAKPENIQKDLAGAVSGVDVAAEEETDKKVMDIRGATSISKGIRGKVVGPDSSAVPGASVFFKENPNLGTVTNMNGEFILPRPDDSLKKHLIASFIGYESDTFALEQDSQLLVMLEPNNQELEEVVVTSYGRQAIKNKIKNLLTSNKTDPKPPNAWDLEKYKQRILLNLEALKKFDSKTARKINIKLFLDESGRITNIRIRHCDSQKLEEQLKKIIRNLGRWEPARKKQEKVSSKVTFEIKLERSDQ